MKKVAVTGADGLVGSRIVELLNEKYALIPLSSRDMDITNRDMVNERLTSLSYDAILHLAGYTNVDGAEKEKELAYRINELGTKNLVEVASFQKKQFIYISTDFVFDGNTPPYVETSEPHPISTYGDSKYRGELAVGKNGMIVRIAYPYRAQFDKKKDIVRILQSLLAAGKPLSMIDDSLMVPTFIDDIAHGLGYLIDHYDPTVFHLVGKDALTPFSLAQHIARTFKLDASLISKTTYDAYFTGKAKRPKNCDIRSIKNTFHTMSSIEEGLSIIKKQLNII